MSWNEPLPLMDDAMINRIIATTDEYLAHVTWRNNCNPQTLKEAVADAKRGGDGGYEKTMCRDPAFS